MERWNGRVALVTGASTGIGHAITKHLLLHGIRVIACGRQRAKIEEIESELQKLDDSRKIDLCAVKCDLRKEDEILAMFEDIKKKYGRLDICINNAGLAYSERLMSGDTEKWREMFEVNVLALSICARETLKVMKSREIDDGYIINIGSLAGHTIKKEWMDANFYAGTKAMVKALTEGLRQELAEAGSNIRVSMISPGQVISEFACRMYPGSREEILAYQRSKEVLTVDDVADIVMYMLKVPPRVRFHDVIFGPKE